MRRLPLKTLLGFLLLAACNAPSLAPVNITPDDLCAHCKMAISEKRYAAELLDHEGEAVKFDDLGCLSNYVKERQPNVAAWYAVDYETRAWLRADQALFVKSPSYHTPMGGGIVAFQDKAQAEKAMAATAGSLLSFDDLFSVSVR
jgi:copper chaperone NosL